MSVSGQHGAETPVSKARCENRSRPRVQERAAGRTPARLSRSSRRRTRRALGSADEHARDAVPRWSRTRRRGRARRPAGRTPATRPARCRNLPRRAGQRAAPTIQVAQRVVDSDPRNSTSGPSRSPQPGVDPARCRRSSASRRAAWPRESPARSACRARAPTPPETNLPGDRRPPRKTPCRPAGARPSPDDYSTGRSGPQRVGSSRQSGRRAAPSRDPSAPATPPCAAPPRWRPARAGRARNTRRTDPRHSAWACGSSTGGGSARRDDRFGGAVARRDRRGRRRRGRTARSRWGRAAGSDDSSAGLGSRWMSDVRIRRSSMSGDTEPGTCTSVSRSAEGNSRQIDSSTFSPPRMPVSQSCTSATPPSRPPGRQLMARSSPGRLATSA